MVSQQPLDIRISPAQFFTRAGGYLLHAQKRQVRVWDAGTLQFRCTCPGVFVGIARDERSLLTYQPDTAAEVRAWELPTGARLDWRRLNPEVYAYDQRITFELGPAPKSDYFLLILKDVFGIYPPRPLTVHQGLDRQECYRAATAPYVALYTRWDACGFEAEGWDGHHFEAGQMHIRISDPPQFCEEFIVELTQASFKVAVNKPVAYALPPSAKRAPDALQFITRSEMVCNYPFHYPILTVSAAVVNRQGTEMALVATRCVEHGKFLWFKPSVGYVKEVHIVTLATATLRTVLPLIIGQTPVAYSPDGKRLYFWNGVLSKPGGYWDSATGEWG